MRLSPKDLVAAIWLGLARRTQWTYPELAKALAVSLSEGHTAIRHATMAGLVRPDRQANTTAILEFLAHGVRYAFVPKRGQVTRGIPTAHAAPPLAALIGSDNEIPPVWPDPGGTVRGESFEPLYRAVPEAAKRDNNLYQALCLVDAIRGGRARDRVLAEKLLKEMLAA